MMFKTASITKYMCNRNPLIFSGSGGYDSMSGLGGYGGGGHMKRCLTGADAVIAKINQRLDMLTQLEGGFKGSRCDR